ncbi:MAG: glycosyltransferase family 9 protein [Oryzomonas sp.]|uniref:glycosyltransferase family 9 protein n=1 Tax=Oryzomonas sp. TaxID=2855186 RepID=UPI002841C898|nr:glycosyltransferase family 9 protein [Oryzomonas sp.]MDR3579877.1 glycosyltransferase family 9 protein [Oryzomonas sp.]
MLPGVENILIVQLGDIGDVVLTTPTIRAVKETYPAARVSIMVRKPFGSLLAADPYLHEVVESVKVRGTVRQAVIEYARFICRLRRAHYDLVIDLRTGDRGTILTFLTGATARVGRSVGGKQFWHGLLLTKAIPCSPPFGGAHVHPGADQSLRIVREIGIDTGDSVPRLHISQQDHERAMELLTEGGLVLDTRWITINPFSRWKYKEWDSKKWGEVVDWLWSIHRISTVFIGSPEEEAAAGEIVRGREEYALNMAGKTTLGELAAIISMSSLHIGVDSAAPHVAAALGTPTVTIHGPSDWRDWRLANDMHSIVCPAMECVPCRRMGCNDSQRSKCLEELSVDTVISQIDKVLISSGCSCAATE